MLHRADKCEGDQVGFYQCKLPVTLFKLLTPILPHHEQQQQAAAKSAEPNSVKMLLPKQWKPYYCLYIQINFGVA